MLKLLESLCDASAPPTKQRGWRAVHNSLIQRSDLPAPTLQRRDSRLHRYYCRPLSALTPQELAQAKKELTVEPALDLYGQVNQFPVFLEAAGMLLVPRYYGIARWGWPAQSIFAPAALMQKDIQFTGTLRPVQEEAIKSVLDCLQECGGALLVKDCGMGKTVDGTYIAVKLGLRTGVLVHNEDLALQWKERLLQWFPQARVGMVQRDTVQYQDMDFVLFMVQSLHSRTSQKARATGKNYPDALFNSIGTLIVDEAHHIGAKSFCDAVCCFTPRYTLAMTATPTRKDRQAHLISWFMGPLAFRREHSADKHVSVFIHRYDKPRKELYCGRNPKTGQKRVAKAAMVQQLFQDPVRNASIVQRLQLRIQEGRKIMVLSTYHCGLNTVYELLKQVEPGVEARFYTGKVPKKQRPAALEAQVIFATTPKGDEALDCPELDTLFRIDPVSESKQPVGRILREHPDKQPPVVEHWWDPFSIFEGMYQNCQRYYRSRHYSLHFFNVSTQETHPQLQQQQDESVE